MLVSECVNFSTIKVEIERYADGFKGKIKGGDIDFIEILPCLDIVSFLKVVRLFIEGEILKPTERDKFAGTIPVRWTKGDNHEVRNN